MFKKFGILVLVVVLTAFLLAGCGGTQETASDTGPIKIGVFEPMTGASAAGGQMTVEGIELANELKSEILGRPVELVIVDNKSDKVEAANAVSSLIDKDNVVAIIGSYGSSLSMAAGDIVKEKKIPAVGCSPTNPLVTLNNDFYFRVCFIDPFQGTVMANYAVKELGAKTAAIIQDVTQDYSVGLSKYFEDSFKELTGDENSIVAKAAYNTGDQDFTAQLTNVSSANPDVIFAPGNYGESALLIKQARDQGITIPILGGDTWESPEFLSIGGDAVEGAVFSTHFTAEAPVTAVSEEFLAKYEEKFNKPANAFAALGYDAYMVILDAIERAGSADSQAIRDALSETKDFTGATGHITLDQNGDAVKSAIIKKVENGEFVYLTTIEPE
ncbi:ABC transporter substrate-binding protein [Tepidimicrobium xylanilyticum]|uniref:Amino acid/amide ABC transporter substrate-binding protein, HAAT family n=1 Tax=Tepidimicrobium xylanilyticum TaxID=1123352 RepID=A0A1H2W7Q3_9FIRM|nr:ABC transporter substrate-binding protein [Tepidimicrobium xylanilyticum]GMG95315.1 branched-chain amino acid ABC transporter substrate-binding protein [Tepidimicrobium xylanilyticum]SDW76571.1 amino acid/amide ABC transporter substrate-binding protein, HAAT family [Tepidimicrobium xylanilyticum]